MEVMEKINIKTLFSKEDIQQRVKELANEISMDYADGSKDLVLVGILNGASIFLADLQREIDIDPDRLKIDFMRISSYEDSELSSGEPKIMSDTKTSLNGKDVILVEDIVDTGFSLDTLIRLLKARGVSSVRVCALLSKPDRRVIKGLDIKYLGFTIPNKYVIGYGLDDSHEKYRTLSYIGYIEE
jgi:hypoxanthine phosphoribosyltransferase